MPYSWLFFLTIFIVLRLVFWFAAFPNSDEAYYWLWGQHPGLSYYDHPPLQAWLQGLFTRLLGRSTFALRLPNLMSNGIFFYTYYLIIRYLYRKSHVQTFWLVVMFVIASPLYFVFLALAWHDHLLITFSLISAYWFIRFLDSYLVDQRGKSEWLYGSAAAIAFAGLSKYNAVFVLLGFLATVITDRRLRPLLRDRRLYLAGTIAACALIPIMVWNVSNHFQSFQYYFNRSINPVTPGIKLGAFAAFIAASFFIVSPFYWTRFYRLFTQRNRFHQIDSIYPRVAFWIFILSSVILTVISLISAALYYWNITAYLLLFPLLPLTLAQNTGKSRNHFFLGTQFYGVLIAALWVVHYTILPFSALVSKNADTDSRMLFGWQEVAEVVKTQAAEFQQPPLLMTTDYRSASALAYQLNDRNVIAVSDRVDQFDFWYSDERKLQGKDAVIVSDDLFPIELTLKPQFERFSEPITVPVTRFGIWIKNYYVRKGYHFSPSSAPHILSPS